MKHLLFVLLFTVAFADGASAEKRVALVIGNSIYRNVARLENPDNDAALMAKTLKELGFVLVGGDARTDLDKHALDEAVQAFGHEIQGADAAMFYYAGHGLQVHGSNYLVPVDANPTREVDVDFQMLDVEVVMNQMQGSGTRLNGGGGSTGLRHDAARRVLSARTRRAERFGPGTAMVRKGRDCRRPCRIEGLASDGTPLTGITRHFLVSKEVEAKSHWAAVDCGALRGLAVVQCLDEALTSEGDPASL